MLGWQGSICVHSPKCCKRHNQVKASCVTRPINPLGNALCGFLSWSVR